MFLKQATITILEDNYVAITVSKYFLLYEYFRPPCIVYNKLVNQIYNYNAVFSHKPIHIAGAIFDSCPGEFSDFSSSKCRGKSLVPRRVSLLNF